MNKSISRPKSLLSLAFVAALAAGCAAPGTPTAGDAPSDTTEMGAPGTMRSTTRGPSASEPGAGATGVGGAAGTGAGGTGTGGAGTGTGGTGTTGGTGGAGTTR